MCDVVWMLPQSNISLSVRTNSASEMTCIVSSGALNSTHSLTVRTNFFWHVQQWPFPVRKWFSNDHWHRGGWKLGSRIVGSSTNEELITVTIIFIYWHVWWQWL